MTHKLEVARLARLTRAVLHELGKHPGEVMDCDRFRCDSFEWIARELEREPEPHPAPALREAVETEIGNLKRWGDPSSVKRGYYLYECAKRLEAALAGGVEEPKLVPDECSWCGVTVDNAYAANHVLCRDCTKRAMPLIEAKPTPDAGLVALVECIKAKCEQYWNEPIEAPEAHAALEYIHREARNLESALAQAAPLAAVGLDGVRPAVAWFAQQMEKRLRRHDEDRGRDGWVGDDPGDLLSRAKDELEELDSAIWSQKGGDEIGEAADLANFAMMIAHNAAGNPEPKPSPLAATRREVVEDATAADEAWGTINKAEVGCLMNRLGASLVRLRALEGKS